MRSIAKESGCERGGGMTIQGFIDLFQNIVLGVLVWYVFFLGEK